MDIKRHSWFLRAWFVPLAFLGSGCVSASFLAAPTATVTPNAAALYNEASTRMEGLSSYHMSMRLKAKALGLGPAVEATTDTEADFRTPDEARLVMKSKGLDPEMYLEVISVEGNAFLRTSIDETWGMLKGSVKDDVRGDDPLGLRDGWEETNGVVYKDWGVSGETVVGQTITYHLAGKVSFQGLEDQLPWDASPNNQDWDVDLYVGKDDGLVREMVITGVVHPLSGAGFATSSSRNLPSRIEINIDAVFSRFNEPVTIEKPQNVVAMGPDGFKPLAPVPSAEALGDATKALQVSQTSCPGTGPRVCLVPVGPLSVEVVQDLKEYLRAKHAVPTEVLPPVDLTGRERYRGLLVDQERAQLDTQGMVSLLAEMFPAASNDPCTGF